MLLPVSAEGINPAVELELRLKTPVSESMNLFLSGCFWKTENFSPDGTIPGFTGIDPSCGYEYFMDYRDSHRGFQLGCEKNLGFFSLQAGGGYYSRKVELQLDGPDYDNLYNMGGDANGFITSSAITFIRENTEHCSL